MLCFVGPEYQCWDHIFFSYGVFFWSSSFVHEFMGNVMEGLSCCSNLANPTIVINAVVLRTLREVREALSSQNLDVARIRIVRYTAEYCSIHVLLFKMPFFFSLSYKELFSEVEKGDDQLSPAPYQVAFFFWVVVVVAASNSQRVNGV